MMELDNNVTAPLIKDDIVSARLNGATKEEAEKVLKGIGLTKSDAIRLLVTQIAERHEFSLELKIPNFLTREALEDSEHIESLEKVDLIDELF